LGFRWFARTGGILDEDEVAEEWRGTLSEHRSALGCPEIVCGSDGIIATLVSMVFE
jgi:hypothetical protein